MFIKKCKIPHFIGCLEDPVGIDALYGNVIYKIKPCYQSLPVKTVKGEDHSIDIEGCL